MNAKVVKDKETEFCGNPNYVIYSTWGAPATQSRDKTATIKEEKALKYSSTSFTITMTH